LKIEQGRDPLPGRKATQLALALDAGFSAAFAQDGFLTKNFCAPFAQRGRITL
jgi:hypothetical protein